MLVDYETTHPINVNTNLFHLWIGSNEIDNFEFNIYCHSDNKIDRDLYHEFSKISVLFSSMSTKIVDLGVEKRDLLDLIEGKMVEIHNRYSFSYNNIHFYVLTNDIRLIVALGDLCKSYGINIKIFSSLDNLFVHNAGISHEILAELIA